MTSPDHISTLEKMLIPEKYIHPDIRAALLAAISALRKQETNAVCYCSCHRELVLAGAKVGSKCDHCSAMKKDEWPKMTDWIHWLGNNGQIYTSRYGDAPSINNERRDFLGIFRTMELATRKLEAIKAFSKKYDAENPS